MFGDLFNEEATQLGVEALAVNSIPAPPGHRPECGLAGISNQGATCYLNSLLQTLLLTPEFREKLFELTEKDLGSLQDKDKPNAKVRVIPLQLQRLFSQLLLSDQQSVSTVDLTNSFGWTNQEEFQQHDVQELNRILFSAIEESLVGTPGQNIIHELYHGTIVNQIICSKCKKVSEREEDFLDLTLAVAGVAGLEAALKQCYCSVEVMDGRNQYRCETCGTYTDATKGAKLRNLPSVLSISLLRFSYDFVKMSRYKENGRFTFPLELDMGPYSEKYSSEPEQNLFELFSVVVHRGSAFGGHYFAYIRDIDSLGHWTNPDSSGKKSKVDVSATGLDVIECQSPVDLIENILGKVGHHSMSIDRLCAEISKETGVSWNKRFKKSHGPINKFLKSCKSFSYNSDTNWVSLETSGELLNQNSATEAQDQLPAEVGCSSSKTNSVSTENTASSPTDDKKPGSELEQSWFCFNDSHVAPILVKDIERQFSGKESAYMLFYRRKSLHRPEAAKGDASYRVPTRLIKEIEELNVTLEKERQEYEVRINNITVKVYWSEHFMYNGLLHLKPGASDETAHFSIDIDKRQTFGELSKKMQEKMADYDVQNYSIHSMKPRCGGYHLYKEMRNENDVLQDMGINNNTLLFVWNGGVIDDRFVEFGEDCEPVQFLVKDGEDRVLTHVILAKNKVLTALYDSVLEATGLEDCQLRMLEAAQEGVRLTEELPKSTDTTLTAAGLKDGDVLVCSGTVSANHHQNVSTQEAPGSSVITDPDWFLVLHNRLSGENSPHTCKTVDIRARSSMTVKDLKSIALNTLKVENIIPENICLREDHRTMGLQPPLREGLSLADTGLSNGASLVIENGRPPQDSEMTISVNKVVSGKLVSKREFLVDRQLTVLDMLQAACRLMDCEGTQWYLSKSDMHGDPADPMDENTATLSDLLINDGDTLILQQGNLIKKDQVALNLWLAPDQLGPVCTETPGAGDVAHRQEEEDKIMLSLAAKLSMSDQVSNSELNPLNDCLYPDMKPLFENQLVISKSMGIEELKQALMGTEQFQVLRIPTSNFMRLRIIEGNRLRGTLRNNSQFLRHANSKEPVCIGVQILNSEENLGVHEMLLNVAQKIGGTRIYMPAHEFLWNTSAGVGAGDLKKAIATRLSLPLHDILIAKYNPDSCAWTVLRDQPQKASKGKSKKKSGGYKTNVRQAPYHVQDGDLIGVKVLSTDKGILDTDDFSTQEDIEKRQLLQQIAEEKKRLREQKKKLQLVDGFPMGRRPEVPLTIKVDKFS